jgi:hypothetical protein
LAAFSQFFGSFQPIGSFQPFFQIVRIWIFRIMGLAGLQEKSSLIILWELCVNFAAFACLGVRVTGGPFVGQAMTIWGFYSPFYNSL